MMQRYRKRNTRLRVSRVHAIQITADNAAEVLAVNNRIEPEYKGGGIVAAPGGGFTVPTNDSGTLPAGAGDWIVLHEAGNVHVYGSRVFEANYELAP